VTVTPTVDPKGNCPDCGGKLLYNGQGLVCIRCPFAAVKPESNKDLPAVETSARNPRERR
jgi:hypothetical protein